MRQRLVRGDGPAVLVSAGFGSATSGIEDGRFTGHLGEAKPAGIPFDENA